jgi:hypothetical protein
MRQVSDPIDPVYEIPDEHPHTDSESIITHGARAGTASHGTKGGDMDPKMAGDPVIVVPEEGGVQQCAQNTPKLSTQHRKAMVERCAERMQKGDDLERVVGAEERRVAADTRRVLVQRGAEGRVQTKEQRRMQVISKNGLSGYGPLSPTNSEGIS